MGYLTAAYITFGFFYGTRLVRRYAQSPGDMLLIVLVSSAAWPFLMYVEKKG